MVFLPSAAGIQKIKRYILPNKFRAFITTKNSARKKHETFIFISYEIYGNRITRLQTESWQPMVGKHKN